jgi:DNA repair protein RadC
MTSDAGRPKTEPKPEKNTPHYHGHRQRLRQRIFDNGPQSLADYEILEYLLFGAQPRGDVRPLAKALIAEFGNLAGVFQARREDLLRIKGLGEGSIAILQMVPEAARRMAREEIMERPVLTNWRKLLDYCRIAMGRAKVEQFRVLYLDNRNRLIADEVQQQGTVDHAPVYPREVVKRALDLGASAIILVHNHPSGDPTPSKQDIEMTKLIRDACAKLGIAIHDHVVISRSGHKSFRELGLI